MAYDVTVLIDDLPGALATVGETLGNAGINIDGYSSSTVGIKTQLHVLVEDAEAARSALEAAGIQVVQAREALTVDMEDQPGELGKVARRIADAGVNIDMVYMGTRSRLIVAVYDIDKARASVE